MYLLTAQTWEELSNYCQAIEDLTLAAAEPNVFYEHWMLIPALKELGAGVDVCIVLVFDSEPRPASPLPALHGLIPLERKPNLYKLPVPNYTSWRHKYCYLCTPLLRRGYEREALLALLAWLQSYPGQPALIQFKHISGEGPVHQALVDVLHADSKMAYTWETFNRAVLKPRDSSENYIEAALSRRRKKKLQRQLRLLSEKGEVTFINAEPTDNLNQWLRDFLAIEASGWKGQAKTALASHEADRNFFEAIVKEAFARNRLQMLAIQSNGKPIAMLCNLLAGEGAFAFKIGYDEKFGQFSPGVLLELENIRRIHHPPSINWLDSCAEPEHFMINQLWLDRRTIQTIILSTGKLTGDLAIMLFPWLKWLQSRVVPTAPTKKPFAPEAKLSKEQTSE